MNTQVLLEIGDPSCDGHSFLAHFVAKANKPLQDVAKAHLQVNGMFESICNEYNDNVVDVGFITDFIFDFCEGDDKKAIEICKNVFSKMLGILPATSIKPSEKPITDFNTLLKLIKDNEAIHETCYEFDMSQCGDGTAMANLWVEILNIVDPTLQLEIISEAMNQDEFQKSPYYKTAKTLQSAYPRDKYGKIYQPGYGIWTCNETHFYIDCN